MTEHRGKRFRTPDSADASRRTTSTASSPRFSRQRPQSAQPVQSIPDVVTNDHEFTVDPEVSGVLPKLHAGSGVVVTNRDNAASTTGSFAPIDQRRLRGAQRPDAPQRTDVRHSFKNSIALLVGLVLVFFAIMYVMFSTPDDDAPVTNNTTAEQRVKVASDGEVEFRDTIYTLSQSGNSWELIGKPKRGGGEARRYLTFDGTPVSLILFEGGFIIPENLSNGTWDVITYTVSDGSVAAKLVDPQGQAVGGPGKVDKAEVSGDSLVLTLNSGETKNVKLK